MPEHLSVSQINCYLNCPRHYMFRYIEKCEPEFIYSALAFGKAMHSALASYNESLQTDAPLKTETVQALFRADWQAETVQPLRFGSTETAESLLATGQTLLAEYVTAKKPEVVACEESFEVMLRDPDNGDVLVEKPFVGVFDLRSSTGFVEFKTAKSALDDNTLSRHLQLSAYTYAYQLIYRKMPTVEVIQFLKLKKAPRIEWCRVVREWRDIRFFLNCAAQVSRGIEKGIFPPNPGWSCANCEHAKVCREN